jgi:hypothetical protein
MTGKSIVTDLISPLRPQTSRHRERPSQLSGFSCTKTRFGGLHATLELMQREWQLFRERHPQSGKFAEDAKAALLFGVPMNFQTPSAICRPQQKIGIGAGRIHSIGPMPP